MRDQNILTGHTASQCLVYYTAEKATIIWWQFKTLLYLARTAKICKHTRILETFTPQGESQMIS